MGEGMQGNRGSTGDWHPPLGPRGR